MMAVRRALRLAHGVDIQIPANDLGDDLFMLAEVISDCGRDVWLPAAAIAVTIDGRDCRDA